MPPVNRRKERKAFLADESAKKATYLTVTKRQKGGLSHQKLERGLEQIYDSVRRPFEGLHLKRAVTQSGSPLQCGHLFQDETNV